MSENTSQFTRSQGVKNQLKETAAQRFVSPPLKEGNSFLSLSQNNSQTVYHSDLSCLPPQEIMAIQSKNDYFDWAKHGSTVGIEIREDYYDDLLEEKDYLEREKRRAEATLARLNDTKNKARESLKQLSKTNRPIKKIEAQIKSFDLNIACGEKFKSQIDKQLQIVNEKLDKAVQIFERHDGFVAIANIPETISFDPQNITLTYNVPSTSERNGTTRRNAYTLLAKSLQRSLVDSPYIKFIEMGEGKEGDEASIQVAQVSSDIAQEDSPISSGHKLNSWTIFAAKNETDEFKDAFGGLANDRLEGSMAKDVIRAVKGNSGTAVTQVQADSSDESYVRVVSNIYKALGGTVLSSFHYVKRPSKSTVFKFVPQKNENIFQLKANNFTFEKFNFDKFNFQNFADEGTRFGGFDFANLNTVDLNYKQNAQNQHQKNNNVGLQGDKNNRSIKSVPVQSSAKKALDFKNKKFAALPNTTNPGS